MKFPKGWRGGCPHGKIPKKSSSAYTSYFSQTAQTFSVEQFCTTCQNWSKDLGKTSFKNKCFLSGIAQITPPLLSGNLYIFFGRHKGIYKVYFLIRARPSPPLIRAMPERKHFFSKEVFPKAVSLKKAKRLKKAVKRLKGCYHLVTAFWPKIIPLSEHQF